MAGDSPPQPPLLTPLLTEGTGSSAAPGIVPTPDLGLCRWWLQPQTRLGPNPHDTGSLQVWGERVLSTGPSSAPVRGGRTLGVPHLCILLHPVARRGEACCGRGLHLGDGLIPLLQQPWGSWFKCSMLPMGSPGPTAALMGSGCRQNQSKDMVATGPPVRAEKPLDLVLLACSFLGVLCIQVEFIP